VSLLTACNTVKVTPLADRVRVETDGKLFTEYRFADGARRPYCYPVLAVDGTQLVRDFPMKETAGEDHDHPHHRGLWFAHSSMNGVDFWNDPGAGSAAPANKGAIVHDQLVEATGGAVGTIRTTERWIAAGDKLTCTSDTTIRFHSSAAGRFVDYEVTVHALPDTPLVIGDNKDGTMGIRLAQWMTMSHQADKMDAEGKPMKDAAGKQMKVPYTGVGHIVTSTGQLDADAWGKRADWCDYYAPREGKTYGVAIFDSPQNLRHPTWWMARDYGLYGANPFGWHDYEKEFAKEPHKGDYTIPAGGSLTLRYRFFLHFGDTTAAKVAEQYAAYVAGK